VTSHHVLFGAGAGEQDLVRIAGAADPTSAQPAARTRHGRCGTVQVDGTYVFVDCATAELDRRLVAPETGVAPAVVDSTLAPGDRVFKLGAVTGRTEGIVIATDYTDRVPTAGRRHTTPAQILVRPATAGETFSAAGDSGAILRKLGGAALGLLWGVDARGFGLACPIMPVLWVLHIRLVQFARQEKP
jgi:hypothetical protein